MEQVKRQAGLAGASLVRALLLVGLLLAGLWHTVAAQTELFLSGLARELKARPPGKGVWLGFRETILLVEALRAALGAIAQQVRRLITPPTRLTARLDSTLLAWLPRFKGA